MAPGTTHHTARGQAILLIEHARLGYVVGGAFSTAVDDVSFAVYPGERVMLLGPSGCGKSTLLKAVAAFNQLTQGDLVVDGRHAPPPGPDRAVVFQEFDQLFPWRTVLDNVAYPLRRNGRNRKEARAQAEQYLAMMGLTQALDRFPHQLSGGMKQRVAIARAFALEPLILLMDEPFASLDAQTRSRLQDELNMIAKRTGVTILFVTHSIDEALILGDRVVVLTRAPSVVAELLDLTAIDTDDEGAKTQVRQHLRALLAAQDNTSDARTTSNEDRS